MVLSKQLCLTPSSPHQSLPVSWVLPPKCMLHPTTSSLCLATILAGVSLDPCISPAPSTPRLIRQWSWLSKGMLPLVTLHLLHSSYTGDEIHTLPPLPTGQHDLGPAGSGTAPHPFPPTLHSTLQPCPLRSLNKPRSQTSGLGLAVPSVIPRLCSWPAPLNLLALLRGFPTERRPRPRPRGSLSFHPYYSLHSMYHSWELSCVLFVGP